ncbi:MAG: site-2 protease family protein [Acidimicrobiia bacterium]
MAGTSVRIGSLFGVEIRIDGSWLVIAVLIGWSLFIQFRANFPTMGPGEAMVLGGVSAILFFGSVLVHELSHSLVARRLGIEVAGITLFLFGGVTETKMEAQSPGDEFRIAVVGPLTSFLLAGVFWGLVVGLRPWLSEPVAFGLGYLALVNLILGAFNLLPGLPLDGGRVLRSILWKTSGSLTRATRNAALGGRMVAATLITLGILQVFAGNLGGLWLAVIGWFLYQAATASIQEAAVRRLLRGVRAGDLMSPNPVTVPADLRLAEAIDEYFLRYDHSAFPVDDDGRTTGLLTLRAVRQIPRDEWSHRQVWATMARIEDVPTVPADLSMEAVLERLRSQEIDRVLVIEGERVVGIITPRDVARWVQRSEELGLTSTQG